MNVQKINNLGFDWMKAWKGIAEKHLANKTLKQFSGDQGILNAFFYEHPELVLELPCSWNYQVGKAADCESEGMFPILHFNHPNKTDFLLRRNRPWEVNNIVTDEYLRIVGIDGYLVRFLFSKCNKFPQKQGRKDNKRIVFSETCWKPQAKIKTHRIFPHFFYSRGDANEQSRNIIKVPACLVTHLDFDKISQLELLCHRWDSNISAAIYLDDSEMIDLIRIISDNSKCISNPKVQLHLVYRQGPVYPALLLQSVALKYAQTAAHLLFVDSDFLPSGGPSSFFSFDTLKEKSSRTLVVPAFEVSSFVKFVLFPFNKEINYLINSLQTVLC